MKVDVMIYNYDEYTKTISNYIDTVDIDSFDTIKDVCGYYEPAHSYHKTIPSICPHCGAPTKPHLNNCEYCDVYFD